MRTVITSEKIPVAAALLVIIFLILSFRPYVTPLPEEDWPAFPEITSADRVLVLAPHTDDETLGAGGLLALAATEGAETKVVVITNGDGFYWGTKVWMTRLRVESKDYLSMGRLRMHESRRAAAALGLAQDDMVFLGYPDRGLAAMWTQCWDTPVTSQYTNVSFSPYAEVYRAALPYSGKSLVSVLRELLDEFKPTILVIPHPLDSHGDHWALAFFALYCCGAIEEAAHPKHIFGYLVHRGKWPLPRGYHPGTSMQPPVKMRGLGLEWVSLELDPETMRRKADAIENYKTQHKVMSSYLNSFIRNSELFARIKPVSVSSEPESPPSVLYNPVGDSIPKQLLPHADISEVTMELDGSQLRVVLFMKGARKGGIDVEMVLSFPGDEGNPPRTVPLEVVKSGRGAVRYEGAAEIDQDSNSALVLFRTRWGWLTVDQMPPVILIIENES